MPEAYAIQGPMLACLLQGRCRGSRQPIPQHQTSPGHHEGDRGLQGLRRGDSVVVAHGQKVTSSPSDRFEPAGPPGMSRYQNWKLQVEPLVICPAGEGGLA